MSEKHKILQLADAIQARINEKPQSPSLAELQALICLYWPWNHGADELVDVRNVQITYAPTGCETRFQYIDSISVDTQPNPEALKDILQAGCSAYPGPLKPTTPDHFFDPDAYGVCKVCFDHPHTGPTAQT